MTALYHDECKCLSALALRVEAAANKLSAVGLDKVAQDLFTISDSIGGVRTMILAKQEAELERAVKEADRGSMDMICGILKVMDLPVKCKTISETKEGKVLVSIESWNDAGKGP